MEKFRRGLKNLFAPAIVLLLVAIMGVFSPVVSVAAAIRLNVTPTAGGAAVATSYSITNLPSRSVELNASTGTFTITAPGINNSGTVKVCHSGKETEVTSANYTYTEVGQYEWRFYTSSSDGSRLFDTYKVNVTDTSYRLTMPDNLPTVAPKDLNELKLPLPSEYIVNGETMEVESFTPSTNSNHYAVIVLKNKKDNTTKTCRLVVEASLENSQFAADKIAITEENVTIDLRNKGTGSLNLAYLLYNETGAKLLVAVPLDDVEIKNVNVNDVTFANIPTAPSVANLSYYSSVKLTAPTADSAKVDKNTSFNVEAQTSIVKVQVYQYPTKPNNWTDSKVRNLTVDANGVVKEGNNVVDDVLEIDGLNVKVKTLGWYRFQFETKTLFGYQMDKDFDNYDAIEQNKNESHKSYVRYWSDSVCIDQDKIRPNYAWVKPYDQTSSAEIDAMNENFSDLLDDYSGYLPMTDEPNADTSKKITVNFTQGLTLPAVFPHDNATSFADLKVTTFEVKQIKDAEGNSVSDNTVYNLTNANDNPTATQFKYNMSQMVNIKFDSSISTQSGNFNEITMKESAGLYRIRISVEEKEPKFKGNNKQSSLGYANTNEAKYLYFYVDNSTNFDCGAADLVHNVNDANSPVIDESNAFMVSDVYLWEGYTFDFPAPTFSDAHTADNNIQIDYYLVQQIGGANTVIAKLDYTKNANRVNVDLKHLSDLDGNAIDYDQFESVYVVDGAKFFVYAVARNFNGMQANLKNENNNLPSTGLYFETNLWLNANYKNVAEIAQYGYAWKRSEFEIHKTVASATPTISVNQAKITAQDSKFVTGNWVKIEEVAANWGVAGAIDGQMSVAAYLVKNNQLVPVDVVDSNKSSAEIISSIVFNRNSCQFDELYFTPGVSGTYLFVVTVKANNSNQTFSKVTTITIDNNGNNGFRPHSVATADNNTYTGTPITLGQSLTLPDYDVTDYEGNLLYLAKNRKLFHTDGSAYDGYYTITVMGVNDPNCVTGNKFTPNRTGTYSFVYRYYDDMDNSLGELTYRVQVNEASSNANILMGEEYDTVAGEDRVIPLDGGLDDGSTTTAFTVGNLNYQIGAKGTGTENKPAYAITLPQFVKTNYGAANDFVIDSAWLYQYLEPMYADNSATVTNNTKSYRYPAIAIPMPNVVSDKASSDEVEITVKKSNGSNYLVSSKKLNAGGSSNKASVISGSFGDYFVFRPEGEFSADCKTAYNASNYLLAANSRSNASGVYTVTYRTNTTGVSYNITFGNLVNGEVSWKEGFLTYNDGNSDKNITESTEDLIIDKDSNGHRYVTIDLKKVFFAGNQDMLDLIQEGPNGDHTNTTGFNSNNSDPATEYYWKNVRVTVSYEDGSFVDNDDWSDQDDETKAIKNHNNYQYKFDLTQGSGTYKVTISMDNSYTSSTVTKSIEFTLDAESTNKNVDLNTVWGIILIVLSVGLLGGVVFYFVKTYRATRFIDAPRAIKANDKKKDTKSVAAPKDVEAPKKDAK